MLWLAGCFRDFLFFWVGCGFGLLGGFGWRFGWISLVFACILLFGSMFVAYLVVGCGDLVVGRFVVVVVFGRALITCFV